MLTASSARAAEAAASKRTAIVARRADFSSKEGFRFHIKSSWDGSLFKDPSKIVLFDINQVPD